MRAPRREAAKISRLSYAYIKFFKQAKCFIKTFKTQKQVKTNQEMYQINIINDNTFHSLIYSS